MSRRRFPLRHTCNAEPYRRCVACDLAAERADEIARQEDRQRRTAVVPRPTPEAPASPDEGSGFGADDTRDLEIAHYAARPPGRMT